MKQEIDQINIFLAGAETVVVEAAHIYADKQPSEEQKIGAEIGVEISAGLEARVRKALLIDNLNIAQNILDKDAYLAQLIAWGFKPDDIFMEKDMIDGVVGVGGILDRIKERKSAKVKNGEGLTKRIWTPERMVLLLKANGVPSCAALDAVFHKQKSLLGQAGITILPEEYVDQQKATQSIMQKAGIIFPTANIYFNKAGGRTLVLNR